MTDPSASIWEVTQLILSDPASSPTEIAAAHGFTMAEIAEMLPFVVENLQAEFSAAAAAGAISTRPPEPLPGESPEEHAARWLAELRQSTEVDLASYDSLDPHAEVADWLDSAAAAQGTETNGTPDVPAVDPATADDVVVDDDVPGAGGFGDGGSAAALQEATAGPEPDEHSPGLGMDDDTFLLEPADTAEAPQVADLSTTEHVHIDPLDDAGPDDGLGFE